MELVQLREALQQRPFRPFTMHMVDGRQFRIAHPDYVYIPPISRHTAVVASKELGAATMIDTIFISMLVPDAEPPENGASNGKAQGAHPPQPGS